MILECKSCQKKFIVPDNAITSAGRLVQCSSCGNKWTQFPIKENKIKQSKINQPQINKTVNINLADKKKRKIKKKSGPSIYSKEYLEKKHGIKINENNSKVSKNRKSSASSQSYFGFYSYLIFFIVSISLILGILNLTKEIIVFNFPFTEVYIEYLFENLNYFRILLRDALNLN